MKIGHLVNAGKTNPKRTQTNPIYPVVASGEAGSNPNKAKMYVTYFLTKNVEFSLIGDFIFTWQQY